MPVGPVHHRRDGKPAIDAGPHSDIVGLAPNAVAVLRGQHWTEACWRAMDDTRSAHRADTTRATHAGEARSRCPRWKRVFEQVMRRYNQRLFRLAFAPRRRRERGRGRAPGQLRAGIPAAVELRRPLRARERGSPASSATRPSITCACARPGRRRSRSKSELPLHDSDDGTCSSARRRRRRRRAPSSAVRATKCAHALQQAIAAASAPFPRRVHAARGRRPVARGDCRLPRHPDRDRQDA